MLVETKLSECYPRTLPTVLTVHWKADWLIHRLSSSRRKVKHSSFYDPPTWRSNRSLRLRHRHEPSPLLYSWRCFITLCPTDEVIDAVVTSSFVPSSVMNDRARFKRGDRPRIKNEPLFLRTVRWMRKSIPYQSTERETIKQAAGPPGRALHNESADRWTRAVESRGLFDKRSLLRCIIRDGIGG